MKTVTMSATGRLTLPAEARQALGLDGEAEFEVEVNGEDDAVILRPAALLRREDAWAYTPEHRQLLERAHDDSEAGRVRSLSEAELRRVGGE